MSSKIYAPLGDSNIQNSGVAIGQLDVGFTRTSAPSSAVATGFAMVNSQPGVAPRDVRIPVDWHKSIKR